LELQGVRVEAFGGAGQDVAQALPPLLDLASAALQDPQPGRPVGAGEEREVHSEAGVLPGLGTGLGQQLTEPLLALRRDLVDDPTTPAGQRWYRHVAGGSLPRHGD